MIAVELLAKARAARRAAADLPFERHPGRLSGLVVGSVPPLLAEGWLGLGVPTPARSTLTV
ncbi:MAG: hypothetical protein AAF480_00435 [Actinomycetota bacterium]